VLGKWLKAGYLEKQVLFATTEGTPQRLRKNPLRTIRGEAQEEQGAGDETSKAT
jgi:hypothetical protein